MWKSIGLAIFGCVALSSAASAACSAYPYTLTNGTTADATQVMANFNCVLGSPVFAGPVGIATTPTHALDIGGTSGVTVAVLNTGDNGRGGFLSATGASGSGTYMVSSNGAAYALTFGIDGVEKARIGTDGSFLVGTTSSGGWNADAKLAAQGSSPTVGSFYQTNNNSGWRAIEARVDFTGAEFMHFFYTSNTVGSMTTDGTNLGINGTNAVHVQSGGSGGVQLTSGATSWAALSLRSQKKDFQDIETPIRSLMGLRAQLGRYKSEPSSAPLRPFLFVEDAKEYWPYAVSPDGRTMRYLDFVPLLVASEQDHEKRMEQLEKAIGRPATKTASNDDRTRLFTLIQRLEERDNAEAAQIRLLRVQVGDMQRLINMRTARN